MVFLSDDLIAYFNQGYDRTNDVIRALTGSFHLCQPNKSQQIHLCGQFKIKILRMNISTGCNIIKNIGLFLTVIFHLIA